MREKEVRELYEAYLQVHQPQEEVEHLDENVQDAVKGALEKGANFMKTNPVGKSVSKIIAPVGGGRKTPTATSGGYRKEEIDLFDTILEHLVAEGYADTNEAALVIMANMSEDWRESIMEGLGGARDQGDYWKREEERNERTNDELGKIKKRQKQRQKEQQAQEFLKKHPKK
jgi:hypothetical protein